MPRVLRTIWDRYLSEEVSTLAGGIGLFALLALPPAAVAVAAIYGLVTSHADMWTHVQWIGRFLPTSVTALVHDLLEKLVESSPTSLSFAAVGSILLAIFGARSAVIAAMGAMNKIAHLQEHRSFWRRQGIALLLTVLGIVLAVAALAALVAAPHLQAVLHVDDDRYRTFALVRWPIGFVLATGYLAMLYRLAPERALTWRGALIGGATAAALWLAASKALALWVATYSDYEAMYGAAGSLLVVLLWFYLSSLAMLIGGIVAAETRGHSGIATTAV